MNNDIDYSKNFKPRFADIAEILSSIFEKRELTFTTKLSEPQAIEIINDFNDKLESINPARNKVILIAKSNNAFTVKNYFYPVFNLAAFMNGAPRFYGEINGDSNSSQIRGHFSLNPFFKIFNMLWFIASFSVLLIGILLVPFALVSEENTFLYLVMGIAWIFFSYLMVKMQAYYLASRDEYKSNIAEYLFMIFKKRQT